MFSPNYFSKTQPQWASRGRRRYRQPQLHHPRCQCYSCMYDQNSDSDSSDSAEMCTYPSRYQQNYAQRGFQPSQMPKQFEPLPRQQTQSPPKPLEKPVRADSRPSHSPHPQKPKEVYVPLLDLALPTPPSPSTPGTITKTLEDTMYEYTIIVPPSTPHDSINIGVSYKGHDRTMHVLTPSIKVQIAVPNDADLNEMVAWLDRTQSVARVSVPKLPATTKRICVRTK
ncbi:expressed protein [Batrachochytrium dendrobatidis JAM81]|uniref:Expressed protein n=1 Tax=Batrachochytrium dendrobatidis (strain JAM81 / FGSC 10211) TaxID=684364 RepID=F4P4X6_BATDJ|nr:uncharacterized protein BATDEDRAFT_33330 [Batrachochytrium dendrobatidis JAM81]EGF79984.1 expressed protein [Batrachochytrium dendrobatidis JAM81]|eukprot:XP_006679525.1 expressed protein [Batrachochytrium dendrobatidis JAM81]